MKNALFKNTALYIKLNEFSGECLEMFFSTLFCLVLLQMAFRSLTMWMSLVLVLTGSESVFAGFSLITLDGGVEGEEEEVGEAGRGGGLSKMEAIE